MNRFWCGIALAGVLGVSALAAAQELNRPELSLRGGFSGNWYDPEQSGHGLQIEVINPREAVVAWYTFGPDGEPVWLFGMGRIHANTIEVALERFTGGAFPPAFDPELVQSEFWGGATLTFDSCTEGSISWVAEAEGFADGEMPLTRLTGIHGARCGQAEEFEQTVEFSLDAGPGGWSALFADYAEVHEIDEEAGLALLPDPLGDREGFMLSGSNASDDLAMFVKHPVGGLAPDTEYRVELEMTFATEVPQGLAGIGGPPGEGVHVKLGASGTEPVVMNENGFFRLNIDHGNQSQNGEDAIRVGDMTNFQTEQDCEESLSDSCEWQLKTVSTAGETFTATTDGEGRLWVYGGSDSGFEGRTTWFLTDFTVRLTPAAEPLE